MASTRRLAAILAADVAGHSRLMGEDEEGTLAALKTLWRDLSHPKIKEHYGRIVKTTGDGLLVEFGSVVDAVRCAVEVQREMAERNTGIPVERRIEFRMGINLGDIIKDKGDIYGDGVNVAARLEALAEPSGICVSRVVRDQVRDKLDFVFEDRGEQQVKNIARPVRVCDVRTAAEGPTMTLDLPAAAPLPFPEKPSIAVLPFQNLSGDSEQEYFADGIVEDIITALSRNRAFFVISRNTTFTYKGPAVDVARVARELAVRELFPTLLVRAEVLRAIGGLDEGIVAYREWDTAIRLAKRFEFGFVPEPTFVYDCRGTDTISKNLLRGAKAYEQILRRHFRDIALRAGPCSISQHYARLSSEYKMAGDEGASRRCRQISYAWWPNPQKLTPVFGSCGRRLWNLREFRTMIDAEDTQRGAKTCLSAVDRDGNASSSKPIVPRRAGESRGLR